VLRAVASDPLSLALRLTLLLLLLQPIGTWPVRAPALLLAAAGLFIPGLAHRGGLWLLLFGVTLLRLALEWPASDNHAYLLCYWCLALWIALRAGDPAASIALSSRLLLVCVFAWATAWKLFLAPEFLAGSFFRITFLLDPRFEDLTRLVAGMSADALEAQRAFLSQHVDGHLFGGLERPAEPARFAAWVWATTLWTIAIEAAIAIAFALRLGWRDALLLVFCVTTFAVAPVAGFGWQLVALGVAQSERKDASVRAIYLGVFALILVFREVPWTGLLLQLSGS